MNIFDLGSRIKRSWNAFFSRDPTQNREVGTSYSFRPDRFRFSRGNERSIVTAVLNRIAMDAAAIDVRHVQLDENNRFTNEVDSGLNNCLSVEANVDQTGRAFIQDAVMSMLDEGCVALIPIDIETNKDPEDNAAFEIETMRVGKVVDWYPMHIRAYAYNELTGKSDYTKILPKSMVAIVENPLYAVMNEPNSVLQRLIRKLNMLDYIDERNSSGKLDLIVQLPYSTRSDTTQKRAEDRREKIEKQLIGSKYGIAWIDAQEKIIQLNRPVENNLLSQIEYFTTLLFSQLGITQSILDGTADDKTMLNYYNRTIEPILSAITDEMKRKFLTKNARTRGQSVEFFRDPFRLVPVSEISEIADKFTRNEIMTSNEIRQTIGMKPSKDPKADELRNKNLNQNVEEIKAQENLAQEEEIQNEE